MNQNADSRASQIYRGLDNVMAEMDKLLSAIQQKTENKHKVLVSCMTALRDSLVNTISEHGRHEFPLTNFSRYLSGESLQLV
jgi:hypothetical protein